MILLAFQQTDFAELWEKKKECLWYTSIIGVNVLDSSLESNIIVPKSIFSFKPNLHAKSLPEITATHYDKLSENDIEHWTLWKQLYESIETSESDFSDYLKNLEDYENKLASGEIKW